MMQKLCALALLFFSYSGFSEQLIKFSCTQPEFVNERGETIKRAYKVIANESKPSFKIRQFNNVSFKEANKNGLIGFSSYRSLGTKMKCNFSEGDTPVTCEDEHGSISFVKAADRFKMVINNLDNSEEIIIPNLSCMVPGEK